MGWGDQEFEPDLQGRYDAWDGPVQGLELNSVIFVGPFQLCMFCVIACLLAVVKNTGGFLIDGAFVTLLCFPFLSLCKKTNKA